MNEDFDVALLDEESSFHDARKNNYVNSYVFTKFDLLHKWLMRQTSRLGRSCICLGRLALVRRCVVFLLFLCLVFVLYSAYHLSSVRFNIILRGPRLDPSIHCSSTRENGLRLGSVMGSRSHASPGRTRIDAKVLLFAETQYSHLGRDIAELLVHNRLKYKLEVVGKSLPILTNVDKGKYGVIVFENMDRYLTMDKWNRELLDKYCRQYQVGIIGFMSPREESLIGAQLRGFPLHIHTNFKLKDAELKADSPVLRITRGGDVLWGPLPGNDWTVFSPNHSTYEPLAMGSIQAPEDSPAYGGLSSNAITVIRDCGEFDGIQRILFGSGLDFWLHRLLFLDAMSFLSHGRLSTSLQRYIQVDIDDIFVGQKGTRLTPSDVESIIDTQNRIRTIVPGFRFNMGYSGKFFNHGTDEENKGDEYLLQHANEFTWFGHMWSHQQPHLYENISLLEADMLLNKKFAIEHGIPTDSGYSVSPHHSGVYPVHEALYEMWKKLWNIHVTSTEEYPHLRPARLRRGFIHRGIMVLPRQTCGLYTHTIFIDKYPGGRSTLDSSIKGGELFQTIVFNRINIFMTHMSNYGNDRLALYTFEAATKFLQCWTNLQFQSISALQLAEKYFRMYPEESEPVWGNPCDDQRHMKIWSQNKTCDQLPRFLVLGPQKTGTTALYTFLSMHPAIVSNYPSPETFEEIQFFNGKNYYRGLDWYMNFFPVPKNSTAKFLFEKSATYFDGELVPRRVHALLPKAKLVIIIISPAKRAYSWYQHVRSHGDPTALNHTFYQVLTAGDAQSKALRDLRFRCLSPGMYAHHLDRWLLYFPPQQISVIDGEQVRLDPVTSMTKLQHFLKIRPIFDYSLHLRYDARKGFFCQVVNGDHTKCLGRSKGRHYPTMDSQSAKYLQSFYMTHNIALEKLLKRLGYPIPLWLEEDLSDRPVNNQAVEMPNSL
ncbi:bifunctional heparan sulfate N-deacetylase/N-sulfotransferase isoform X1 [Daphnia magna]|uniref:bifunctional heparan sulfate N-deacetylase/N-sulfotransferase isoform X1 n=2 Tax=Daphnia magna TaxID=35525 RepID=UPI001E1BABCB|nr:bifunctional heparan sulfate N-deacetylase/N-sulfotransferase isoform X1 [Daphnia magna]XP_032784406.2 bifunctional heparan sulfate N-deacetylase/N-sulfotransferase isoform X1 [Daphnia magna]XP_032784407.2 bifunctional heparan sulfate N-deacetylase/N-sulfotransferase isoform X1 [Daphnia magna]XP_045029009.1 bifunctional heparan sulfate N-deacetylase/N-sulfotransferase isoform X1 [Daphnia magna]